MASVPTQPLPSGNEIPMIGFGTWNLSGEMIKSSVRTALDAGYNHIDTAEGYKNESEIGEVLTDYDRSELFLSSKLLPKNLNYESVVRACEASLDRLGTDYLDLYLIHWPNPAISLQETLNAMETLHDEGLVRKSACRTSRRTNSRVQSTSVTSPSPSIRSSSTRCISNTNSGSTAARPTL